MIELKGSVGFSKIHIVRPFKLIGMISQIYSDYADYGKFLQLQPGFAYY